MNARTSIFLLLACMLYPFILVFTNQTVVSLQMSIILTPLYIYIVGWSAVELEKEEVKE